MEHHLAPAVEDDQFVFLDTYGGTSEQFILSISIGCKGRWDKDEGFRVDADHGPRSIGAIVGVDDHVLYFEPARVTVGVDETSVVEIQAAVSHARDELVGRGCGEICELNI